MKPCEPILLAAIACLALPASAQYLRCANNEAANVGDSKASVLFKCGEPVVKDASCKAPAQPVVPALSGTTVNVNVCEPVDEWTYRPGYGQFVTTLRFESGTLKKIKYGERIN